MLKKYLLIVFLSLVLSIQAQIRDPLCINCAGNNVHKSWLWDWSMGESIAIQTFYLKNKLIVSSGYLQPNLLLKPPLAMGPTINLNLVWGPNPVKNDLLISSQQLGIDILNIEMKDSFGHTLQKIEGPFSSIYFFKKISMASVNTGIYFIVIRYIAATIHHIKVIKVQKI